MQLWRRRAKICKVGDRARGEGGAHRYAEPELFLQAEVEHEEVHRIQAIDVTQAGGARKRASLGAEHRGRKVKQQLDGLVAGWKRWRRRA